VILGYTRNQICSVTNHAERFSAIMSNTLTVRLTNRKTSEGEYYEATADICGLRPTKLVRRTDNTTRFPTKSSAQGAIRNFAKTYNFTSVNIIDPAAATTQTKKAAKKSTTASRPADKTASATSNKSATAPAVAKSKS